MPKIPILYFFFGNSLFALMLLSGAVLAHVNLARVLAYCCAVKTAFFNLKMSVSQSLKNHRYEIRHTKQQICLQTATWKLVTN